MKILSKILEELKQTKRKFEKFLKGPSEKKFSDDG